MSETARIKENQDALKASGLIEAAPAPTGVEVYERAMAKLDNEKVRARLEFTKGSTTPEKKTPEQIAALEAVLAHFTEIEARPEGDEKTALVAEFKAANWELILRPEEIALLRAQVDDHLAAHEENGEAEPEAEAEGALPEEDDKDRDGVPDLIDADSGEGTQFDFMTEHGGVSEAPMDTFIRMSGLQAPVTLAEAVKAMLIDPAATELRYGEGNYVISMKKSETAFQLELTGADPAEGTEVSPEWTQYRQDVLAALTAAGLTFASKEVNPLTSTGGVDVVEITPADFEGFVAPEPVVDEPEPEATSILNEEGFIENEDGTLTLPDAGTRTDGSLPAGEALQAKWQEVGEAWRDGNYGEAMAALVECFSFLVSSISEKYMGVTWDEVEDPVGIDKKALEKPSQIEELYKMVGDRLSELKYKSFDAIKSSVTNAGDRIAAAALLGAVSNVDCANPSENHCSGWVDTIAQKMGISRYDVGSRAYVNPKDKTYRGWAKGAPNRTNLDEIGGLQPGDMVIAFNDNGYTGYHDQIVIEVKGDKVLVASQTSTKGSSGTRKLQWKTLSTIKDKIAVVTRPGWSPSQPNS